MIIALNGQKLTNIFERIEWGGDTSSSSRYVEATMIEGKVECGDTAELFNNDGTRLFVGKVFRVDKDTDTETITFKAFDNAIYLNKNSFVKNFFEVTPSEIAKSILAEIGIPNGRFPQDLLKCTFPAIDRTGYDIIMSAYTMQHAKDNKKIYSIISEDNAISVVEKGTLIPDYILDSKVNVRAGSYSSSIEEMINKVVIYKTENEKAQIIDVRPNNAEIEKYGIFQAVQQQTEENKALVDTQKILKGLEERGQLTVDGMNDLISGYTVAVSVPGANLVGTFLIDSDYHVWEHDDYYCELSLNFENVMNTVEIDQYEKKKPKQLREKKKKEKKLEWNPYKGVWE